MTEALHHPPSSYIDGRFLAIEGDGLVSTDPASPDSVIWQGSPPLEHVDEAIEAARRAFDEWSGRTLQERASVLKRWQEVVTRDRERIAGVITDEMARRRSRR